MREIQTLEGNKACMTKVLYVWKKKEGIGR